MTFLTDTQILRRRAVALQAIFFLSGAAALVFETLWFRLCGLVLGNTVWASSLVLAAFMSGLSLGGALAARHAGRWSNPVLVYALIELVIAASGIGLVIVLPSLGETLSPLFGRFGDLPGAMMLGRLAVAFVLLLVPATAMGMSLPLLAGALGRQPGDFAPALGRLYGWNTLGAVLGALAPELWMLQQFGIRNSGWCAAALNLSAALVALGLAPAFRVAVEPRIKDWRLPAGLVRPLLAAGLCGALLLAVEVVWFRFQLLYVRGTGLAFAVMLAVVLAGIATGGLLAAAWLKRRAAAPELLPALSACSGLAVMLGYLLISPDWARAPQLSRPFVGVLCEAAVLSFVPACLSGLLFTFLGARIQAHVGAAVRAGGLLTLANTGGAAVGALLGGFVLLPWLGMEQAIFALALGYLVVSVLTLDASAFTFSLQRQAIALGVLVLPFIAFPFGRIQAHLDAATQAYRQFDGSRTVFGVEGLNETVQLLRQDLFDQPLTYRLVTNGYSMSNTARDSQRYMKLFAWWPLALHPRLESALLISYGLGTTASGLVGAKEIRRIAVVDISSEILEASRLVYRPHGGKRGSSPLADPRVQLHIEDGRQFLQTTRQRYDLVTAEPPPPRLAGVVNLYTREYFALLRQRLRPGGMVTYWLPVDQLTPDSARAVLRGFCDIFPDCSLWAGSNYNWMMVGINSASGDGVTKVSEEQFAAQWRDPIVAPEMTSLGFEKPEQLGACFIADAAQISRWVGDVPPLTDDFPLRLADAAPTGADLQLYSDWMDDQSTERRFKDSNFIRHLWPDRLHESSLPYFAFQAVLNNQVNPQGMDVWPLVDGFIRQTDLRIPVLWLLQSGVAEQRAVDAAVRARGYRAQQGYHLGVRALAERDFGSAQRLFSDYVVRDPVGGLASALYAYCADGQPEQARGIYQTYGDTRPVPQELRCWQ